jgi:hypothetical protein
MRSAGNTKSGRGTARACRRSLIGTVRSRNKLFEARDAKRRVIGKFKTVRKAANAICKNCKRAANG